MVEEKILSSTNWKNRNDAYYEADVARVKSYKEAISEYNNICSEVVLIPEAAQFYIVVMKNAIAKLENACDKADDDWAKKYRIANQTWPPDQD